MTDRTVLSVTGSDRVSFLQGLITNNVPEDAGEIVYAALLTPQGKFIADFFLSKSDDGILLDVAESHADMIATRLGMYKLRADVTISPTDLHAHRGVDAPPPDAQGGSG